MSIEKPTMNEIVPPGTALGWSDTLYSLLAYCGKVIWFSSTPTEDVSAGPGVVFAAQLHRIVIVDRPDEPEWAAALKFRDGSAVSIPRPGFRGALLSGRDMTIVTDGATMVLGPVA